MFKKYILLGLCSTLLLATVKVPMDPRVMSTDNGGLKDAASAYEDGVGIVVSGDLEQVDNKSYNDLVVKYGDEAEAAGQPLKQYLEDKTDLPEEDQLKLDSVTNIGPIVGLNGTSCNDGNSGTVSDVYDENNVCLGLTPIDYCSTNGFDGLDGSNCYDWSYSIKLEPGSNIASVTSVTTYKWKIIGIDDPESGWSPMNIWTSGTPKTGGCGPAYHNTHYYPSAAPGTISYQHSRGQCQAYSSVQSCPSGYTLKDSKCRKTTSLINNVCPNAYYLSNGTCYAKDYNYCKDGFEEYGSSTECRQQSNLTPLPN